MKKHIPNLITSCNLLSGAVAVLFACRGEYPMALLFILIGAVFDFFDGMSARVLHVSNPRGKELDSLADDITFGLAPTLMLFTFVYQCLGELHAVAFCVLPMAAFSALRLAKFNLDERQTDSFRGLATPANALFWASLISWLSVEGLAMPWLLYTMVVGSWLSCYLLVCDLPLFSLKFHDLSWQHNRVRYVFLIGAVLLVLLTVVWCAVRAQWAGIYALGAIIIVWYVGVGVTAALAEQRPLR